MVLALAVMARFLYSQYLVGLRGFILYIVAFVVLVVGEALFFTKSGDLHLHEWYYPIPLMFFALNTSNLACAVQALLIGIHVHGVCATGFMALYEKSDSKQLLGG